MPSPAAPRAILETPLGEIEIEFLADKAPGHVKNFTDLAKKGSTTERRSTASSPAS
jgi:cyclophilin family peptidyl-prolyl cis-trans isomerase